MGAHNYMPTPPQTPCRHHTFRDDSPICVKCGWEPPAAAQPPPPPPADLVERALKAAKHAIEIAEAMLPGEYGVRWPPNDDSVDTERWDEAKALVDFALRAIDGAKDVTRG